MKRPDAKLLLDMLLAARRAHEYVKAVDREDFENDVMRQDAVVKRLEIIGEAAGRVSDTTREAHPTIPWQQIVGMRNRLIHEYFGIDLDIVWNVARHEVPPLIRGLEPLVPRDVPEAEPPSDDVQLRLDEPNEG